ncbi:VWA domain-containing protein [Leeia sp. TBRC 13508]|uniref:VWA domain-containing protein n=1 Tax=Leeia speluncae TaxID=2884804 RepID=A0ABS8D370_9NEIS|nr:VWA domain-containing protein [Leeia speluncae]MCB6182103.1 VWA domain-containing protein [Leeia speluncae]
MKPTFALSVISICLLSACTSSNVSTAVKETPVKTAPQVSNKSEGESQMVVDAAADISDKKVAASVSAPKYAMSPMPVMRMQEVPMPSLVENTEKYQHQEKHGVMRVQDQPVSTFSIDVDTGAYSNVRRFIQQGELPPADAVRVEEMVNYFPYQYALPAATSKEQFVPFGVQTEIAPAPWNAKHQLLKIGIKASDVAKETMPPVNLVFLVDVSGSMESPDKLPLLKKALKLLTHQLRPQDSISLVTYASGTKVVLRPGHTPAEVNQAIDELVAGGGTNGASGIDLAYSLAESAFKKEGINRIVLATDGDFNVGVTRFETLKDKVAEKRKSGISLTTLGFGQGNYNDQLMEQLADAGDGQYAYIDNLNEAQKVLVDQFTSSMVVVAKDVKLQLEFNPSVVKEYRQIGFENRALKAEDFKNDQVDAGEIGAGHTVTALYEITLAEEAGDLPEYRYDANKKGATTNRAQTPNELAYLKLRYKLPQASTSKEVSLPITRASMKSASSASTDFQFAAAVAAFGDYLGNQGKYLNQMTLTDIEQLANRSKGADPFGYRAEFVRLVHLSKELTARVSKQEKVAKTMMAE